MPPDTTVVKFAVGIWSQQVRFIGAGTIAVAAVWTLVVLFKPLAQGARSMLAAMHEIRAGRGDAIPRTERDLPMAIVLIGSLGLVLRSKKNRHVDRARPFWSVGRAGGNLCSE